MKSLSFLIVLAFLTFVGQQVSAQNYRIVGTVLDSTDRSPVAGAYVSVTGPDDAAKPVCTTTGLNGSFEFAGLKPQKYLLKVSYLSYGDFQKSVEVKETTTDVGTIILTEAAQNLNEVKVVGQIQQSQMKGDTTQFNAAAFKTNPDATVEDLIQKMPGISVVNGEVQAQGEKVQRVMVDGKQFFGEEATLALRNLPAELVDKIEVFDRQSGQRSSRASTTATPRRPSTS